MKPISLIVIAIAFVIIFIVVIVPPIAGTNPTLAQESSNAFLISTSSSKFTIKMLRAVSIIAINSYSTCQTYSSQALI